MILPPAERTHLKKGVYRRIQHGGQRSAVMTCPQCGRYLSLGGHIISPKGHVALPVPCPCGWKETVTLQDWAVLTAQAVSAVAAGDDGGGSHSLSLTNNAHPLDG